MRSAWLTSAMLAAFVLTVTAQSRGLRMSDPLFGIAYDPEGYRFEEAPSKISALCPDLHGKKTWVYAHLKSADAEYFIVSGYTGDCSNGKRQCYPDIVGTGVLLRGAMCSVTAVDSFYWDDHSDLWKLSESLMNDFAKDAIQRYLAAFGGRKSFLDIVSTGQSERYLAPALRRQLETIRMQR